MKVLKPHYYDLNRPRKIYKESPFIFYDNTLLYGKWGVWKKQYRPKYYMIKL
jgi:hypothetical protein